MHREALERIHRVRTVQLGLARAQEVRAREQEASEAALGARIAALAAAVSPAPAAGSAVSLGAAAHYRERLHQSAEAAIARAHAAADHSARADAATKAARRDQAAVEKLMERVDADALVRERRALEDVPGGRGKRHGPC